MNIALQKPIMIARQRVGDYFPGLNPKTLANLNSKGEGPKPYIKNGGRTAFYITTDIQEYLTGVNK